MKSSHILAVVALIWGGGIVLLHMGYVKPSLARQSELAERENAAEWLRRANFFLRARRNEMLRLAVHEASEAGLKEYFWNTDDAIVARELSKESLRRHYVDKVILCDADRRVISAWKLNEQAELIGDDDFSPGQDLTNLSVFRLCPHAAKVSGVGNTPLGLMLFARCAVEPDDGPGPEGYVVALRQVDGLLFAQLAEMVGISVTLRHDIELPPDKALPTFGQVVWREDSNFLRGAQVFRDSFGSPVGYLMVRGEAKATRRHARIVARALTIMLLWAVGFALLMVMVIQVVVAGPTAKLVNRVERLRGGEEKPDLSVNLRGEALVLARRFEEVLGRVERMSQTDALTDLRNRRSFQQVFDQEFRRARRYGRALSLAMMDIDFFKAVNDALGHQSGDAVLTAFAEVIRQEVRLPDAAARLGGDEFAVLMPETSADEAVAVIERIHARLAEKVFKRGELKMTLTVSAGVVDMDVPAAETLEAFFNLADQAMYVAKRNGRNRIVRADSLEAQRQEEDDEDDRNRVDRLCRQVARLDAKFKRLFVDAIGGLISALEARDIHTANHSVKVRRYATLVARKMGLSDQAIEHLARAAMLHDIGKIGLPDSVLLKEGNLTDEEWNLVRRHSVMSVRIMEGMAFLDQEIPAVRNHHERYDGRGYPEGLAGSAIPLAARILAVADAFDAMTSSRVYRGGLPVAAALEELRRLAGTQFDPAVVEAFLVVAEEENITDETLEGPLVRTA